MYPINEAVGVAYFNHTFCSLIVLLSGFVIYSQHNPLLSYVDYEFDLNSCYLLLDPVLNTPEFCHGVFAPYTAGTSEVYSSLSR